MGSHPVIHLEIEICEHLKSNGWLYELDDAAKYDRARALFPEDVQAWVRSTQPKSWDVIEKNHGSHAIETLLTRLRDQIDQRGTLDVMRHGIEMLGMREMLLLAQFKPAHRQAVGVVGDRYAGWQIQLRQDDHQSGRPDSLNYA